ncbi:MAG: non-canonical purine NTP pyrophosphatase [bacterium]
MTRQSTTPIRFVSRNTFKLREAAEILKIANVEVIPLEITIEELQTQDTERLVKHKTMRAFQEVGRPLFVEHTGLYLDYLKGLPGGLTQIFWDTLEADNFAQLFGQNADPTVIARTVIGYTDARRFFQFQGEVRGRIAAEPVGDREFQWDCVFVPEGSSKTFAEMGEAKHEISMRRKALDAFAAFLKERWHDS